MAKFDRYLRELSKAHARQSAVLLFLISVFWPLCIAALGVFTPYLYRFNPILPIILWVVLFIAYCLTWYKSSPNYAGAMSLLASFREKELEADKLREKVGQLDLDVFSLSLKNVSSFALRRMAREYICRINEYGCSRSDLEEIVSEIFAPFYIYADHFLGAKVSEKWNIALYLHDRSDAMLKPVWRECSKTHPSEGLGRSWRQGEGHVGKCFLDRKPLLTGDATDETIAQFCKARGSQLKPYDDDIYISFACVPISLSTNDDDDPYGVLVATSDVKGRFSDENVTELLMHYGETLASILDLTGADLSCLFDENGVATGYDKGASNGESGGQ